LCVYKKNKEQRKQEQERTDEPICCWKLVFAKGNKTSKVNQSVYSFSQMGKNVVISSLFYKECILLHELFEMLETNKRLK
jgi:hypothetical protein